MNRGDASELIRKLSPPEPPCFGSRLEWLEWLEAALICPDRSDLKTMPLVLRRGNLHFNYQVDFCSDCLPAYKAEMVSGHRCRPTALVDCAGALAE